MEPNYKLKKLLKSLEQIKGRHTELISVYIPQDYKIVDVSNQLKQEQGTAVNIKSKTTRKNVLSALEKVIQYLKLYKQTPEHGLAVFCGNVSKKEGVSDIKLWAIEPPEPLKVRLYRCDQTFILDPLKEQLKEKELYGLIVLDNSDATIGLLKGKNVQMLRHFESIVPGKEIKGGQCQPFGSLVVLSDGNIAKIETLKEGINLKSADFNTFSILDSPILDVYKTRKSEIYKIITKYPRLELKSSKDHFFFVFENGEIIEKPAQELKVNDIVLMPEKLIIKGKEQKLNTNYFFSFKITTEGRKLLIERRRKMGLSQENLAKKINVFQAEISEIEVGKRKICTNRKNYSNLIEKICEKLDINFVDFRNKYIISKDRVKLPEILNEELAQIVGYFVGDGNYDKNRICFSEGDKELAEYYKNKIEKLFNSAIGFKYREKKRYYQLKVYSKVIEKFFKGEFLKSKNSSTVLVPEKILKSPDVILASFLRGLFNADGYVSRGKIGLGINNKTLAQQVQLSLLRFGILSSLLEYDNKRNPYSKNYRYTVDIGEKESVKIFYSKIGFSLKNKMKNLFHSINKKSDLSRVRRVLVSGKNIREIIEKFGMKKKDFPRVSNFFQDKRFISKFIFQQSILNEISNDELYSQLKMVLDCPIIPVIIKKIEKYEKNVPMIDLAVKNESFISNGILVHNSAMRFARVREGLKNDWYKQIAERARGLLPSDIKGIIIGGPGPAKEDFYKGGYLITDLKNKVIGVKSVGYATENGLNELVGRSSDILAEAAVTREKQICQIFLSLLQKESGLVAYGLLSVLRALEAGAVETLLVSEGLEYTEAELKCGCGIIKEFINPGQEPVCQKCGQKQQIIKERDAIEAFEELAKQHGSRFEIISRDTVEGNQVFQLGGIVAVLRWKLK